QVRVAGATAAAAGLAVVLGPLQPQLAEQAEDALGAVADAAGALSARRAAYAGAAVPPWFRSRRAVAMALAPRRWTASRTSNSVRPSSWVSDLRAHRRASSSAAAGNAAMSSGRSRGASASWSGVRGRLAIGISRRGGPGGISSGRIGPL